MINKILGKADASEGYTAADILIQRIKSKVTATPKNIMQFLYVLKEELDVDDAFRKTKLDRQRQQSLRLKENLVVTITNTPNRRVSNNQSASSSATFHHGTKTSSKSSVDDPGKKSAVRCYRCGRTHVMPCTNKHPDVNNDKNCPWFQSPKGKAWKQRGEKFLPEDVTKTLENTPLVITQPVVPTAANQQT